VELQLQLESYLLTENNKNGRYLLTKLRSGTNELRIETGRWKRPREEAKERICMACMSGEVEDEKHFMLHCCAYESIRNKMYQTTSQHSQGTWNVGLSNAEAQWRILMRGTEDRYEKQFFEIVKTYVAEASKRRSSI